MHKAPPRLIDDHDASTALRSDLAAAVGDRTTARWWAGNVALLWSEADPPLRDVVTRMRAFSEN